jgi:hypothetical protein
VGLRTGVCLHRLIWISIQAYEDQRSIELPITAERFLASVQEHARLTGASIEEAFQSLLVSLSDENLERLEVELSQRYGHLAPYDAAIETAEERTPSPTE